MNSTTQPKMASADSRSTETANVNPEEFESLLISYRHFERYFDLPNNTHCLRERDTGKIYRVSAIELDEWKVAR